MGLIERDSIGDHAEDGNPIWSIAASRAAELGAATSELDRGQLASGAGRPVDEVGEPNAVLEQRALASRSELLRCEPGPVKSCPEPAARVGEVMMGLSGADAGIDAHEEDLQAGSDDIGDDLGVRHLG